MSIQSYKDCQQLAQSRKRKIDNNTYLNCDNAPQSYAIRLHETDVVTYHKGNRITLDSGGWKTVTTKARINEYSPCQVWSEKGIWYVVYRGKQYNYADGITLNPNGTVSNAAKNGTDKKLLVLRKRVKQYAKDYVQALYNGNIDQPSNADCWGCLMVDVKDRTKHPMGGPDHILSHFDEKYYVPSLVFNACEAFGASIAVKNDISCLVSNQHDEMFDSSGNGFIRKEIEKYVYRWCLRELGV